MAKSSASEIAELRARVEQLEKLNNTLLGRLKRSSPDNEFARMFNVKFVSTVSILIAMLAIQVIFLGLGWSSPFSGTGTMFLGGMILIIVISFWVILALRFRRRISVGGNIGTDGLKVKAQVGGGKK